MFGYKCLCIFYTFLKLLKKNYLDEFVFVLSAVPTVIVLSFQEAKAKPKASGCKAAGRLFFFGLL